MSNKYSKYIRSKQDVIPLCPQNTNLITYMVGKLPFAQGTFNNCSQFSPSPIEFEIPIHFNASTSTLEQNGVWLRYKTNYLDPDWSSVYVSPEFINYTTQTDPTDNSTYTVLEINYENVLPNGKYLVEFDYFGESNE